MALLKFDIEPTPVFVAKDGEINLDAIALA